MNIDDMEPEEQLEVVEKLQEYAVMFDQLCIVRHEAGQEEYGQFTFLENDIIRMMCEELADTANYARYQFIKLMILQERLAEQLSENQEQLEQLGINTFRGTRKAWEDATRSDTAD